MRQATRKEKRRIRHARVRGKIQGTALRPRLVVFHSNKHIYGSLVDDERGYTLCSVSDFEVEKKKTKKHIEVSKEVGNILAKKAATKNIAKVVFDRGGYVYTGNVKAVAEGAKEGGLKF